LLILEGVLPLWAGISQRGSRLYAGTDDLPRIFTAQGLCEWNDDVQISFKSPTSCRE